MSAPAAHARQRGFTLLELMVAVTVSSVVLAPALALLFAAAEWSTQSSSRIRLNQQARLMHSLLLDGSATAAAGKDGFKYAYGVRGQKDPVAGDNRKDGRLEFKSNNLTVSSDSFARIEVQCAAAGDPLPRCKDDKGTEKMEGFLGDDAKLERGQRSVANRTAEATLVLTDPFEAQRLENPGEATETYRMIVTTLRDENDP